MRNSMIISLVLRVYPSALTQTVNPSAALSFCARNPSWSQSKSNDWNGSHRHAKSHNVNPEQTRVTPLAFLVLFITMVKCAENNWIMWVRVQKRKHTLRPLRHLKVLKVTLQCLRCMKQMICIDDLLWACISVLLPFLKTLIGYL